MQNKQPKKKKVVPLEGRIRVISPQMSNGPAALEPLEFIVQFFPHPERPTEAGIWRCAFRKRPDLAVDGNTMDEAMRKLLLFSRADPRIKPLAKLT